MNLYDIKFKCGFSVQEYGDDVADVKRFCALCYKDKQVDTITLVG